MRNDLVVRLEAERLSLLEQLHQAERAGHEAARVMYRRGYLAGHSAGRRNARRVRGPYGKTLQIAGGTDGRA